MVNLKSYAWHTTKLASIIQTNPIQILTYCLLPIHHRILQKSFRQEVPACIKTKGRVLWLSIYQLSYRQWRSTRSRAIFFFPFSFFPEGGDDRWEMTTAEQMEMDLFLSAYLSMIQLHFQSFGEKLYLHYFCCVEHAETSSSYRKQNYKNAVL